MVKLFWILLQQEIMEVVMVTTGTLKQITTTNVPTLSFFTGWTPFLLQSNSVGALSMKYKA